MPEYGNPQLGPNNGATKPIKMPLAVITPEGVKPIGNAFLYPCPHCGGWYHAECPCQGRTKRGPKKNGLLSLVKKILS